MEKSKVIRSLIYKFTERFAAKLIGFVIQIILARLLLPELFGQVVLLQTVIDFFVLVIENGACAITEADCPDKLCVGMGKIHYSGQSIICLPHQVVIAIVGENPEIDEIAG